jgi:hypothetical protein
MWLTVEVKDGKPTLVPNFLLDGELSKEILIREHMGLLAHQEEEGEWESDMISFDEEMYLMGGLFTYCDEDDWLRWIPDPDITEKDKKEIEDELSALNIGIDIEWDYVGFYEGVKYGRDNNDSTDR